LRAVRVGRQELGRRENLAHHVAKIAASVVEARGDPVDEPRRRRVADEPPRQLGGNEARRGRMCRENVEHLFTVSAAAAGLDAMPEHDLLSDVVDTRLEPELAALSRVLN